MHLWEGSDASSARTGLQLVQTLTLTFTPCTSPAAGMRQLDAEYRLDKNIKIAMLYLEDDDAVSAEAFIKKASALIGSCKARLRVR